MTKKNIILISCILIVFGVLMIIYGVTKGWFNTKSKASVSPVVSLRFDPVPAQVEKNGPFSYTIKAKSNQSINIVGYLFSIGFDKTKIQLNSIEYKTGVISQGLGQDTGNRESINQTGNVKIQAEVSTVQSLVFLQNTDFSLITISGNVLVEGIPQFSLSNFKLYQINTDSTLTEVNGEVDGNNQSSSSNSSSSSQASSNSSNSSSRSSSSSSNQSNQSSSSSSAQQSVKITFKMTYRLQGVLNWLANKAVSTKFSVLKNNILVTSTINSFSANLLSDLFWHGQIERLLIPGNDYVLLIKPDKHLQRKVCSLIAHDSTTLYSCGQERMTLSSAITEVDLSGLTFFAGDITGEQGISDGKIDSLDYAMIQQIIQSNTGKDPAQIAKADLNYDGIVDTQDASLIIEAWQKGINQDER